MITGWILFDERGRKLTRHLFWSQKKEAGWLWSEQEARAVIGMVARMDIAQPIYCQYCELVQEEDGDVNVYALDQIQKLEGE